jgi:hypothetical protein
MSPAGIPRIVVAVIAAILAGGCAAPQSRELKQARESFMEAQNDPTITQRASVTLHEAKQSLERALKSISRKKQRHFAYLALKQTELARMQARQQQKQQDVQILQEEQDQFLFDLRRRQVEQARREAEQAQRDLQTYLAEEHDDLFDDSVDDSVDD